MPTIRKTLWGWMLFSSFGVSLAVNGLAFSAGPFLANGIKIGELTPTSVRMWTRLTAVEKPDMNAPKFERTKDRPGPPAVVMPAGLTIDRMEGAVPGMPSQVRVVLTAASGEKQVAADWQTATKESDCTAQFQINDLTAGTLYNYCIEARPDSNSVITAVMHGTFRTAPPKDSTADIVCTTASDHEWWDRESNEGHKVYKSMLKLNPDFFVHSGDYVYYDRPGPYAVNISYARHKWNRMNGLPNIVDFYSQIPSYFQSDDHDTYCDDARPGQRSDKLGDFTFEQGLAVHYEQTPLVPGRPYRTFRWGKDLQIWLVDGREFRTPQDMESKVQPTIWGKEQIEWFKNTVQQSDATFKVLFTPSPMVGPDRDNKHDNYADKTPYQAEGRMLREFMAKQGMFSVTGDRHWQYVSVDSETGLREYGHGPASDAHAQGWKQEDKRPQHRFLRVKGGFLAVYVSRKEGKPSITFVHYDVDGKAVHTDKHYAKN